MKRAFCMKNAVFCFFNQLTARICRLDKLRGTMKKLKTDQVLEFEYAFGQRRLLYTQFLAALE